MEEVQEGFGGGFKGVSAAGSEAGRGCFRCGSHKVFGQGFEPRRGQWF